jgi:hypothetical protein
MNGATVLCREGFSAVLAGKIANVQMLSHVIVQKFSMHERCRTVHDAAFELFKLHVNFLNMCR